MKKLKYHDYHFCPKCSNMHNFEIKDRFYDTVLEVSTSCKKCRHQDYWAHGFYQSIMEGDNDD